MPTRRTQPSTGELHRERFREIIRDTTHGVGFDQEAFDREKLNRENGIISDPQLFSRARELALDRNADHVKEVGALLLVAEPTLNLRPVVEVYRQALDNGLALQTLAVLHAGRQPWTGSDAKLDDHLDLMRRYEGMIDRVDSEFSRNPRKEQEP